MGCSVSVVGRVWGRGVVWVYFAWVSPAVWGGVASGLLLQLILLLWNELDVCYLLLMLLLMRNGGYSTAIATGMDRMNLLLLQSAMLILLLWE